ncbi:MAG: CBS domain-containing protein [Alphaproteobacteria bacterium]|nr:CBS domain-containing protein [Alphaproteobacteria bacterium]
MDVSEAMVRDVALLGPDANVREAARAMAENDSRAVLIGSMETLQGILTERDILIRVVAAGLVPGDTSIGEVMSTTLFTCRDDQNAADALAEMTEHRVEQMPVLDRAGRLCGLLNRAAADDSGRRDGEPGPPP